MTVSTQDNGHDNTQDMNKLIDCLINYAKEYHIKRLDPFYMREKHTIDFNEYGIVARILITGHMCLLILLTLISQTLAGRCPQSTRVLHPCHCHADTHTIECGPSPIKYSLRHVFHALSEHMADRPQPERQFRTLLFNNPAIEDWESNLLGDISFHNITIDNARALTRIASNAFNRTGGQVRTFTVQGPNRLGAQQYVNQLFDALSSLANIREVSLELPALRSFPSYAFVTPISGAKQAKFERFWLRAPRLHTVPNYAFYELHALRWVTVRADRLSRVEAHAFDFEWPANHVLHVDLQHNRMPESSVESDCFMDTKRPVRLLLGHNGWQSVARAVFEPLLNTDPRNVIDLAGNPLRCDCRIAWLIREPELYRKQLVNGHCVGDNGGGMGASGVAVTDGNTTAGAGAVSVVNVWSLDESRYARCDPHNNGGYHNYTPELVLKMSSSGVAVGTGGYLSAGGCYGPTLLY
ncbi:unnamed protein product [Medioppia subpectinata]|uniref:Uncharacterized protein n=1 Tax=Medioppia subpectinata TaxID=1979941 RepID=A0A7R9Q7R5_9ACAR|nr:unnamed protein product [Medioppia subpectinata]CAG2115844.1 unnamed protein product [Medioppia subpectinata]